IYRAILKVRRLGDGVDLLTVAEAIPDLHEVGGAGYLAEIAANTPSTTNLLGYARAVKVKSQERAIIAAASAISESGYDTELSIDEKISAAQKLVMAIGETQAETALLETNSALKKWTDEIDKRYMGEGAQGLMTGFKDIDKRTNGLQPADLIILAARPSMGKTTMAMNIAEHVAIDNRKPVLVFSMEMGGMSLWDRMGASLTGIPFDLIRRGKLRDDDWPKLSEGVSRAKNAPLYIDERAALGINQIQATARRLHRKLPLSLIVVDYLQLATAKSESREREVSRISGGLKALAKELNVPVIALSQLNRDLEKRNNKRPMNADLRDSGSLEQDADLIFFIYRDEVYNDRSTQKGIAELICTKFRNGEIGTDYLATRLEYSRFENLIKPYAPVVSAMSAVPQLTGLDYQN
ncbi:replicative DNA helicase, partial [Zhongshania sp.]|uniref:replicative DNA helicase n=1 Tax=Zhongshania sp. TaxID=1971902 RepID=UPI001B4F9788